MALTELDSNVAYIVRPWGSLHSIYNAQFKTLLKTSGLPLSEPSKEGLQPTAGTVYLAHFGNNPFLWGQFDDDLSLKGHVYRTENPERVDFFKYELLGRRSELGQQTGRANSWISSLGTIPLGEVQPLYEEFKKLNPESNYKAIVAELNDRTKTLAKFVTGSLV